MGSKAAMAAAMLFAPAAVSMCEGEGLEGNSTLIPPYLPRPAGSQNCSVCPVHGPSRPANHLSG